MGDEGNDSEIDDDFDPYETLDLTEKNWSEDEVKKAAARKSDVWNPKRNQFCKEYARKKRQLIEKAADVLLDPTAKAALDRLRTSKRQFAEEMRSIGVKRRKTVREDSATEDQTTDEPILFEDEDTLGEDAAAREEESDREESTGGNKSTQQQEAQTVLKSAGERSPPIASKRRQDQQQQIVLASPGNEPIVILPSNGQSITITTGGDGIYVLTPASTASTSSDQSWRESLGQLSTSSHDRSSTRNPIYSGASHIPLSRSFDFRRGTAGDMASGGGRNRSQATDDEVEFVQELPRNRFNSSTTQSHHERTQAIGSRGIGNVSRTAQTQRKLQQQRMQSGYVSSWPYFQKEPLVKIALVCQFCGARFRYRCDKTKHNRDFHGMP